MSLTRRLTILAPLACPFTRVSAQELPGLEAAARKEGEMTWYTSHTDGETAQTMLDAFAQRHPGIRSSVIRTTAQVAYQRLLQDMKNGIAQCDVFSTTDLGHDEALRTDGKFAKWVPPDAGVLRPEFKDLDPGNTYYPTLSELVVPIYNTNRVTAAEAPQRWTDFLDPKWRNQIAVGHPAFSGTVGTWVVAMRKLYGWSYFEKLERNKPLVGRSANDAISVATSGERRVGIAPSSLSQVVGARGNPVGITEPSDGAVLIISPSAVMANAPHPNAARLFMSFLLGPDMSRISENYCRLPVRADAPATMSGRPFADIKTLRLSTAEIVEGVPEVIEQWRDTFGT